MSVSDQIPDDFRFWIDLLESTGARVNLIFSDRALLAMLSGAVFALQQDTHRALGIDMRNPPDTVLGAAIDKMQPHTLGPFHKRVFLTMEALNVIDSKNLDYMEKPRPASLSEKEHQAYVVCASMRLTAARVWLLTWFTQVIKTLDEKPSYASILELGVVNMWMRLGVVPAADLLEDAKMFTGGYFPGVTSEPMSLAHWPYRPEVPT
jgi:hypothetical protein